jgi:hypothetical protein
MRLRLRPVLAESGVLRELTDDRARYKARAITRRWISFVPS